MNINKAIKELETEAKKRKESEPEFAELLVFAAGMLEAYSALVGSMMKTHDKLMKNL